MDKQISVLIVDNSAVMRKRLTTLIEASPELYVVGKARNGVDAVEKAKRFMPNVVILDTEMPEMNGLAALEQIMRESPTSVIVLSNESDSTLESFSLGAVDFIVKEEMQNYEKSDVAKEEFHQRILIASKANILPLQMVEEKTKPITQDLVSEQRKTDYKRDLIIIGTSTGGPAALQKLLPKFPEDFSIPILVIQHMPVGFTKSLAERMDQLCPLRVKEVDSGERMEPGVIYIAPAGLQTLINKEENGLILKLTEENNVHSLYKPSVDVSLLSVATTLRERLITIILTGMGDDGLRGCKKVKEHGGTVLAQSEESCIVYGMPKVVFEAGIVDEQASITYMYTKILKYL